MKTFVNKMKLLEEGTRKDFIFNMSAKHYWNITDRRKYSVLYQTITADFGNDLFVGYFGKSFQPFDYTFKIKKPINK